MNVLKRIGKVFRNKTVRIFVISVLSLFAVFKLWDCLDFAFSRGSADPKEMAREEKLWKLVTDIDNTAVEYQRIKGKSIDANSERRSKERAAYSVQTFMFSPLDYAKMQKSAADSLRKYNQVRQQLLQITDNGEFGCRDDVLMYAALDSRDFTLTLMYDEMLANTGKYYGWAVNSEELISEYYRLYSGENKDREFKYPDFSFIKLEKKFVSVASLTRVLFCAKAHGGYRLWQGRPYSEVQKEFDALFGSGNAYVTYSTRGPARIGCLERRLQRGSKFAAFWLPTAKRFSFPQLYDNYMLFMLNVGANRDRNKILGYTASDGLMPNYIAVRTPEERLWHTVQYVALNTDNYLWRIKFNVEHPLKRSRLQQVRVMPRFGRKSPEMQTFSRNLAADAEFCRSRLKSADFKNVSAEMKKASLELCAASEMILRTWENYSRGKISYDKFYRMLKQNEMVFEKKRLAVLSRRWDYMYYRTKGNGGYIVFSLRTDGVTYPALQRLVKAKLHN